MESKLQSGVFGVFSESEDFSLASILYLLAAERVYIHDVDRHKLALCLGVFPLALEHPRN